MTLQTQRIFDKLASHLFFAGMLTRVDIPLSVDGVHDTLVKRIYARGRSNCWVLKWVLIATKT